ncbi:MAG: CHAT domain-containing protein [Acidobacteriota bacterium]
MGLWFFSSQQRGLDLGDRYSLSGNAPPHEEAALLDARELRWQQHPDKGLKLLEASRPANDDASSADAESLEEDSAGLSWVWHLEVASLEAEAMRFGNTIKHLERARRAAAEAPDAPVALLTIYTSYGNLYRYLLQSDAAEFYYRKAQEELARLPEAANSRHESPATAAVARLHASLYGYLPMSQKEEALRHARLAAQLGRNQEPETAAQTARVLASSLLLQRQPEECLPQAHLAARIARDAGIIREEVAALNLAALALLALERDAEAIETAERAAELASQLKDPQPYRTSLQLSAQGHSRRDSPELALKQLQKALEVVEEAWENEPVEALRRDYLLQGRAITTQILSNLEALQLADGRSRALEAFKYAERTRGRSLLAEISLREEGTALDERHRQLLEEISRLARRRLELTSEPNVDLAAVETLEHERFHLVARLITLESRQHRRPEADGPEALKILDAGDVQKWLEERPDGSTVVLYQLGPSDGFVVALNQRGAKLARIPGSMELEPLVRDWRHFASEAPYESALAVTRGEANRLLPALDDSAEKLGQLLLQPVQELLDEELLIILPDDVLHGLPFESLYSPGSPVTTTQLSDGASPASSAALPALAKASSRGVPQRILRTLIAQHRVLYAPSVSVIARPEPSTPADSADPATAEPGRFLLLGDPIYRPRTTLAIPQQEPLIAQVPHPQLRNDLQRLPASRREVLAIDRIAREHRWRTTLWTDGDASEARLREADLQRYRLIHLATHAMTDSWQGDWSAMVLSASNQQPANPCDEASSSLTNGAPCDTVEEGGEDLFGAADPPLQNHHPGTAPYSADDDGILTAADIAQLDLSAELVVLSGCETGLGQVTGAEGVLGLARAFLSAGATQVMASLWKVEDSATSTLMTAFYQHLFTGGLSPSEALRVAKLELASAGVAERTWAAFVLVGVDPQSSHAEISRESDIFFDSGHEISPPSETQ